jgi:hypothetical protein
MTRRWLAGIVLFALGFGSSSLIQRVTADTPPPREGNLDAVLHYVDGADLTLKYPQGTSTYLLAVKRTGAGQEPEEQISYKTGSAVIPKKGLSSVTIFRLVPIGIWQNGFRPCHGLTDCPVPRPLPPPPPPIMIKTLVLDPLTRVPGDRRPAQ